MNSRPSAPLWNRALIWLRAWGLGERTLKTALAAALAWFLGSYIPGGDGRPYLATLAAILTMQITVASSFSLGIQRVLGVVVGVIVALISSHLLGLSAWSVGLIVLLAFALGSLLRLGAQGLPQVAISALLVLVTGSATPELSFAYALSRVLETMLGAAVGIAVNALLIPPARLPAAEEALQAATAATIKLLDELATALASGIRGEQASSALLTARHLSVLVARGSTALAQADDSLRYNIFAARARSRLIHYRFVNQQLLEYVALHLRGIARTINDVCRTDNSPAWLAPSALGNIISRPLATAAQILGRMADPEIAGGQDSEELKLAQAAARDAARDLSAQIEQAQTALAGGGWVGAGALINEVQRMLAALAAPSSDSDNVNSAT